jgi:predicted ATPase/DNA-binding NarL/FixJ family response regulator
MGQRNVLPKDPEPDGLPLSIPAPLTRLIGRAEELEGVTSALGRARLVTLAGPAGVGKTRIAIEVGREASRRLESVSLVDLATVAADEDVAAETARALGVRGRTGDATTRVLVDYLTDRDALLVLDNCEHVLEACSSFAATLLGACSSLRILATSREPLGIAGELVWRLEPLVPDDAYRLFLERARERRPDLIPDERTETTILEICARLDNLPLGIELAAARVSAMSPQEILAGVEAHLGGLGGRRRAVPAHHRSVGDAVELSYTLLDPVERRAFRSLAVFVGGFDADGALTVAPGMTLDVLARLVDKSLITVIPRKEPPTRYRLLETVRECAMEHLLDEDDADDARTRHLQHFSTVGIPVELGWMSARARAFLQERAADYGNVRAAIEWAAVSDPCAGMRLLAETKDLFFMMGQADGSRLAELVLKGCPERNRYRVEVKIVAGHFAFQLGDIATSTRHTTEAVDMSTEVGDPAVEGSAHWFMGLHQMFAGAPDEARGHFTAARNLHRDVGDRLWDARTTAALGLTYLMGRELDRARELLEEALEIGVAAGDRWSQGQANLYLGILAESSADRRASSFFREAVECMRPYDDATLLPVALIGLAGTMTDRDPATALKVIAAGWALRAQNGGEFPPFFRAFAERIRTTADRSITTESERLWKEGLRLGVDDAIALVYGTRRPRATRSLGLSDRELDVVRLISEGMSNKQIAARLHISVRTVESHVRHVLTKASLENRTQLATWARERL